MARFVAAGLVLLAVWAMPASAAAQPWDPAATISAYSTALSKHDVDAALALFDEYGSATDRDGHTFSGRDGLSTFLRANGFGAPNARIATQDLQIVANRAIWDYTCSCASGATEVRMVLNEQGKISVFAMVRPRAAPAPQRPAQVPVWLLGLAGLGVVLLGLRWRMQAPPPDPRARRASQGRLLAGLREAHARSHPPA